jgi:hypothetical protein
MAFVLAITVSRVLALNAGVRRCAAGSNDDPDDVGLYILIFESLVEQAMATNKYGAEATTDSVSRRRPKGRRRTRRDRRGNVNQPDRQDSAVNCSSSAK